MGGIPLVREWRNTGTGYPTGLRKPYFDKATDIPIYCQARQWHLWLKPVPVRSQIVIWDRTSCVQSLVTHA